MADVTLHLHRIKLVVIAPYLDSPEPFAVIRLDEGNDDTRVYVQPRTVQRGREVAAAIMAACDAVQTEERKRNAVDIRLLAPDCVPIESLAPTVHPDDLAPTVLEESDLELARRVGERPAYDWDPAA